MSDGVEVGKEQLGEGVKEQEFDYYYKKEVNETEQGKLINENPQECFTCNCPWQIKCYDGVWFVHVSGGSYNMGRHSCDEKRQGWSLERIDLGDSILDCITS